MRFEKVTHYVENSYENKPSFKIEMGDGDTYLSNGCQFIQDTPENREYLIDVYDCQSYLDELNNSPIDSHDSIKDASFMMWGSEVTEFEFIARNLESARYMLEGCDKLTNIKLVAPNLKYAEGVINGCDNIENFELVAPPHIME